MPSPTDIICFAKDWNEPKTSNNHVMEELARQGHRVLWVNPLPMRTPTLRSAHDRKKILRKVRGWLRGIEYINEYLCVLSPVLVPLPLSRFAQSINRRFVTAQVRRVARHWGFSAPQLWIFPPNAVDFIGRFHESAVVYYCTDEWSQFGHLNAEFMRQKEATLLTHVDVVFVTSQKLLESKSRSHPCTHLVPHGVNHTLFARALEPEFAVADELRNLPHPIIGFYGNLYDWVDQDLIVDLVTLRPNWSFVLVGKIMTDVTVLQSCKNVHLTGMQPYEELPRFCKGFDVGLIPYKLNDPRMATVNPLKLREYLAAGVPVVSVDLPEVRALGGDVAIASGVADFVQKIESALLSNTLEARRLRSEHMRSESWQARIAEIERIMMELQPVEVKK
jgi:glycosyltransferase involved in cell wall biosynthesis